MHKRQIIEFVPINVRYKGPVEAESEYNCDDRHQAALDERIRRRDSRRVFELLGELEGTCGHGRLSASPSASDGHWRLVSRMRGM